MRWRDAGSARWPDELRPAEFPRDLKHLLHLTDRLIAIVATDPFAPAAAREVGAALVALHFTQPESLGMTMEVFGVHLLADLDAAQQHALSPRLGAALGELATGFTAAMRTTILAEQESIRSAVIVAQQQAEEALRESEARFHAVFGKRLSVSASAI